MYGLYIRHNLHRFETLSILYKTNFSTKVSSPVAIKKVTKPFPWSAYTRGILVGAGVSTLFWDRLHEKKVEAMTKELNSLRSV